MVTWFSYLISYFKPIIVAQQHSAISGKLEVSLEQGRLLLNSDKVNYSGGSLFFVFDHVFEELGLKQIIFHSVLVLGFGTGSILELLKKHNSLKITGVEIDPCVIELGKHFFSWPKVPNLTVFQDNAFLFLSETTLQYDLILVDVFIHDEVPEYGSSEVFWGNLNRKLLPGGYCLMNWMPTKPQTRERYNESLAYAQQLFTEVQTVFCQDNIIIVGKK